MNFERARRIRVAATALVFALAAASPIATRAAEDAAKTAADTAPASAVDPQAAEIVQRLAERIVAAERIRLGGEMAWDVVQADGETIEFGATRELVLQRPDHLRVDIDLREGGKRRLLYDGQQIVLEDLVQNVYASAPQTGPVDDVVALVADRFGIPVALSELLSPELPKLLSEHLTSASYVGESTVDGVLCDHVALRNDTVGLQLWIGREDSLPRRITITYEHEEGRPQFRARFTDWDLSPKITKTTFAFEPPKGSEKIAFAPRQAPDAKEDTK